MGIQPCNCSQTVSMYTTNSSIQIRHQIRTLVVAGLLSLTEPLVFVICITRSQDYSKNVDKRGGSKDKL
ncbi:hypothetical protein YC2023_019904 [Brassica napus]